ncbi:hypothetical protein EPI10_016916 [Gossypium australe]|uniref:Uncharacterized protein n=1 Tax=Gossypium australe TaxID=47621 RepID=A0A5B6VQE6_9ROSI|nr:hypothetical protein EPI10_016916 [Gossypium australe]
MVIKNHLKVTQDYQKAFTGRRRKNRNQDAQKNKEILLVKVLWQNHKVKEITEGELSHLGLANQFGSRDYAGEDRLVARLGLNKVGNFMTKYFVKLFQNYGVPLRIWKFLDGAKETGKRPNNKMKEPVE